MKQVIATIKHTPLLHNGEYYPVGTRIKLSEQTAQELAYYLTDVEEVKETEDATQADADNIQEAKKIADELDAADAENATTKASKKRSKAE